MTRSFQQIVDSALTKVAEECGCGSKCEDCGKKECTCEDKKINKVDASITPVPESKKEASRIADVVLQKLSKDWGVKDVARAATTGGVVQQYIPPTSQTATPHKKPANPAMNQTYPKSITPLQKHSNAQLEELARWVGRKMAADSLGGAPANSGVSSGGGGGTLPKATAVPSMGGMPPAPGQMGAAQPKRLDPLQKQN